MRTNPQGYFQGCKLVERVTVHGQKYLEVVYCPVCKQPVRPYFGVDRCGCQEPHSHLP